MCTLHMFEGIWATTSLGFCTANENTPKPTALCQNKYLCYAWQRFHYGVWALTVCQLLPSVAGVYSKHTEILYYACMYVCSYVCS